MAAALTTLAQSGAPDVKRPRAEAGQLPPLRREMPPEPSPERRDLGPPNDGGGSTHPVYAAGATEPTCLPGPYTATSKGWICEHRARSIANMVQFRRVSAGAPVVNAWNNGQNQLAFSRGDRGFVAINHEATPLAQALPTGLAPGSYCDVLSGDFTPARGAAPASCSGTTVEIDASGNIDLDVAPETALAIHASAKL